MRFFFARSVSAWLFASFVFLLRFLVVGLNLSKCVTKSCRYQWSELFCLTNLNCLLFCTGLLSFNRVFGVLFTPGGFGNKVFQNITVERTIFSQRCLCVAFRRSLVFCCCISLLSALICQNVLQNRSFFNRWGRFV